MKKVRLDIGGPKGNAWVIMGAVQSLCKMEGRENARQDAKDICAKMRGDLFEKLGGKGCGNSYEDLLRVFLNEFPYVELYSTYELPIDPELYTLDEDPEILEL